MGWYKYAQSYDIPPFHTIIRNYIKDEYMSYNYYVHSKIKPIGIDQLKKENH